MLDSYRISRPFFEFGPKAYLYGAELLALMRRIDVFANRYDMDVIADVQTTDLRMIAENTSPRPTSFPAAATPCSSTTASSGPRNGRGRRRRPTFRRRILLRKPTTPA